MITIAHLSDLHLDGGARAAGRVRRALEFVAAARGPVDVVLVTGDVTEHGLPAEYDEARELFATLPGPVLMLPGNHDARPAFAAGLLGLPPSGDPVNRRVRHAGAEFLLCDSTIPGKGHGELGGDTVAWLDAELAQGGPDVPALVCFHHPPVVLHAPYVDPIRQFGEDGLADVLRRHPRVRALLCGHAHTAAAAAFAGLPLRVAPGLASIVRTSVEGGPEIDLDLPPTVALHLLDDDGMLVTHYRPV